MTMNEPIRILLVEDLPTDAELNEREIRKSLPSCRFERVETREEFLAALDTFRPDLIVSDYSMPRFDGLTALRMALEHAPQTPVIIVTSALNEDTAVECMKAGAIDYVIKEHIKRLGHAVLHALEQKRVRAERRQAEEALLESEERLRQLADNINTVFFVLDLEEGGAHLTYLSPAFEKVWGIPCEEAIKPQFSWISSIHPEDRHRVETPWNQPAADCNGTTEMEYRIIRPDGDIRWISEKRTPVKLSNGRLFRIVGLADDISERKVAEGKNAELQAQLLHAQRLESVGRLAGGVAHDFNNILTVILGNAELMKIRMPADSPVLRNVLEIEKAANRSKDITQQLLAFSRKQVISPRVIDLDASIRSMEMTLGRLIGEDIELRCSLQQSTCKISFDPTQIDQVLMNLVLNARDAMPNGGRLTIETSTVSLDETYCHDHYGFKPGHYVLLTVSDDGVGMDKETLSHIFEPFFTTKEAGKGTGLGLATVYGIVTQNGGFINVYSEPGQGTTFKAYIPCAAGEYEESEKAEDEPVSTGSGTILLVEDDEVVRGTAISMLEALGYTVIVGETPQAALSLCEQRNTRIDLLLTDVVMPGMKGTELRDRIAALYPSIRTLFMSGYTSQVIVNHGVLDERVNFIPKPFSVAELSQAVSRAMGQGNGSPP